MGIATLEVIGKDDHPLPGQTWLLNVDNFTAIISRTPVLIPLPTGSSGNMYTNNRPLLFGLDMGQMSETVNISGVTVDNGPTTEPGVAGTFPGIIQLSEIARCSWANFWPEPFSGTPGHNAKGGVRLVIEPGPGQGSSVMVAYQGTITNFVYARIGGNPRWEWKMTIQVANFPQNMVYSQ